MNLLSKTSRGAGHASRRIGNVCIRRHYAQLPSNPHIHIFADGSGSYTLSLLNKEPPTPQTSIGRSSTNPPKPGTFESNPHFERLLNDVLEEHAASDPDLQSNAKALASASGSFLGSSDQHSPGGAGGASNQGGAGGGARGGWIHVYDYRNAPDYGRIPYPEDIFGSVEVGGDGNIVENGNFQPSGTYRIVTNEGILGLSPYLMRKLLERLRDES